MECVQKNMSRKKTRMLVKMLLQKFGKMRKKIIHHLINCKKSRLQNKQMEGIINHKKIQNN